MALDQLISQRFDELAKAAIRIARSPSPNVGTDGVDPARFRQWAVSSLSLIKRACGDGGVHAVNFQAAYEAFRGWRSDFQECHGIFKAAREDYAGGYLFSIRALIDAELCSDILDQADVLLVANHKDAACVVAGVALETAILEMSKTRNLPAGKLDTMNHALAKAGAYNMAMQKQITAWADLRNNAAHGKWDQYKAEDVRALVAGVRRFVAEKV